MNLQALKREIAGVCVIRSLALVVPLWALIAGPRAYADQPQMLDARACALEAKAAVDTRLTEEKVIYELAGGTVTGTHHKIYFDAHAGQCLVDMQFHIVQKGTIIINRYVTDPESRVIYAALTQSHGKKNPESDEAKFVCNYGVSYDEINTCNDAREFDSIVKALTTHHDVR